MKIRAKIFLTFLISFFLFAGILFLLYLLNVLTVDTKQNTDIVIVSGLTLFLITLIFGFFISFHISKSLQRLLSFLHNFFTDKNLKKNFTKELKRKDEFGAIFKKLYEIYSDYLSYLDFAENLKAGNYKAVLNLDEKQKLAGVMNDIKENLITAKKEQKYNSEESEKYKWYQSGITDFTLLLQQDFQSTKDMAYPVVKKTAEHLGVEQVGIFVLKKDGDKELLVLEAAFAYDKKKQLDTEIEIGESLVGKCAKEQKLIRINDLPEGYTYISSGLGEDTPKSLILMPLMYEKRLFGVLEIASLKNIPDYKINFLHVIGERIASEISTIHSKIITAKLAEDYKKQSKELALKEKKSEQQIAELTQEKNHLLKEIELLKNKQTQKK